MGKNYENKHSKEKHFDKSSRSRSSASRAKGRDRADNKSYPSDNKVCVAGDTLHNDPSWYEPFSGSTEMVARVSFGNPLGQIFHHPDFQSYTQNSGIMNGVAFPGIMRIDYIPCPGIAKPGDVNAPINYLSQAYYTTVRYAQRGSGTYDDSDLMLAVLGISSCYELWAWMRRLYGVLNMYAVSNKYVAEALFRSMGGDFADFQSHIYDFQGFLNNYALRLGQFCLPADFHIVDRRVRLNSNIYTDGTSAKAQMYYFNPSIWWKYNELANEKYAALEAVSLPEGFKYNDLVTFANDIYMALRTSQSLMNMAGDVKNAYGDGAMKKITTTDSAYLAPIMFDDKMATEIQNLTLVGSLNNPISIKAEFDTNLIEFYPCIERDVDGVDLTSVFFNFRDDVPTPEQVMRATRLIAFTESVANPEAPDSKDKYVCEAGTEFCTNAYMYYYYLNSQTGVLQLHYDEFGQSVLQQNMYNYRISTIAEKFDYHPYMYIVSAEDPTNLITITGDVDNVTLLAKDQVAKMNLYAIMGLIKTSNMNTFLIK